MHITNQPFINPQVHIALTGLQVIDIDPSFQEHPTNLTGISANKRQLGHERISLILCESEEDL